MRRYTVIADGRGRVLSSLNLYEDDALQLRGDRCLYSASDLINFMGCAHATTLDLRQLTDPVELPEDDEQARLLQEKGIDHEVSYLERLKAQGLRVAEIENEGDIYAKAERTRSAMAEGYDVIYQAAFVDERWQGYADFLLRRDGRSNLGDHHYEVADTKLSRAARPKHLLQMCLYSQMLEDEQAHPCEKMHVVLGDGSVASFSVDGISHYFENARTRFLDFVGDGSVATRSAPCGHCKLCRWSTTCKDEWEEADHLSLVAGLTRTQAGTLETAGVGDIPSLARLPAPSTIPGIGDEALTRLVHQARLQQHYRTSGERIYEDLPVQPSKGLNRLPRPDEGDIFFDMEGDPLFDGGLEYLFGAVTLEGGEERFHTFWAHDREEEKRAFQNFMDFAVERLRCHPAAHIYHYALYEETALKRLAMFHGTREAEVDDLLRNRKLVDLYRVVRESIRTSEPAYSIKNMEKFYLADQRQGEVTTAGDSIVMYERWRQTGEDGLLEDIAEYNRVDCSSTLHCRDWLVGMRGEDHAWFEHERESDERGDKERTEAEQRMAQMASDLLDCDEGEEPWRRLLVDLLEFHRRESKPAWWAVFSRQDLPYPELLDDAECLAGLEEDPDVAPYAEKRSVVHTFRFPPQDFKLKVGDTPKRAGTLEPAGEVVQIDEDERRIALKLGPSRSPIEPGTSLIPSGPIGDKVLREAVYRFAEAVRDGKSGDYSAVRSILRRDLPALRGREPGEAIVRDESDVLGSTIEALSSLEESHLLIQGPPGAGKTYNASHAIVALLEAGARVGVSSNGHKAINQLLTEVERVATSRGLHFRGVKKSSREEQMLGTDGWIEETFDNEAVTGSHQLVAGTPWLFARPEHDQAFDYLFIDEAGQVGLANIVATGVSARNIVLVGDQMQLSQPIQGTHPDGSGVSALEHLLQEHATVPPEMGVFLSETRRMHPHLCGFISAAVYDRRLRSAQGTGHQRLLVDACDDEAVTPTGLRFIDVDSSGCTQRSKPEADRLAQTYRELLGKDWQDAAGRTHEIGTEEILVVSPYNMQVELLKRTLPEGARVGTVDKFQGQEAPVVLISMATSSGDDLPRNIEFLYSRNRLNVAISRARCLAVIFANPRLLEIPCRTIEEMELVNGLCWARSYARTSLTAAPA